MQDKLRPDEFKIQVSEELRRKEIHSVWMTDDCLSQKEWHDNILIETMDRSGLVRCTKPLRKILKTLKSCYCCYRPIGCGGFCRPLMVLMLDHKGNTTSLYYTTECKVHGVFKEY